MTADFVSDGSVVLRQLTRCCVNIAARSVWQWTRREDVTGRRPVQSSRVVAYARGVVATLGLFIDVSLSAAPGRPALSTAPFTIARLCRT